MSFIATMATYTDNTLTITDDAVAKDWRYGLLRSLGNIIQKEGTINEATRSFGLPTPNGMRSHMQRCTIVAVHSITEDSDDEYSYNAYSDNGGDSTAVTLLAGIVSCKCGDVDNVRASAVIYAGEFVSKVTS